MSEQTQTVDFKKALELAKQGAEKVKALREETSSIATTHASIEAMQAQIAALLAKSKEDEGKIAKLQAKATPAKFLNVSKKFHFALYFSDSAFDHLESTDTDKEGREFSNASRTTEAKEYVSKGARCNVIVRLSSEDVTLATASGKTLPEVMKELRAIHAARLLN